MQVSFFWGWAQVGSIPVTVRLADSVATGSQRDGFFIVHRHPGKCLPDLSSGSERIWYPVYPLRVDIDEPHLNSGQRVFHRRRVCYVAVAVVTGRQPLFLRTPVGVLLRVPKIWATKSETKSLEPHRLVGNISGQNHQVCPAEFVAVFLFNRPQQTAGLVEVCVVWPRVQRGEALGATSPTTPAISGAVGTSRVPGHTNHQAAIVAPVGWPPVLAGGHKLVQVFFESIDVKFLDLFAVVKVCAQRVSFCVVLVQNIKIEGVRPPFHIGSTHGG